MDEDYFAIFSPEEISAHIKMSCALARERPAQCRVTPRGPDEFDIVIVGFDYLSEFSVFCGLLSAFGLDIRAGDIYSFGKPVPGRAVASTEKPPLFPTRRAHSRGGNRSWPGRIVDVFSVGIKSGESFEEAEQREFEQELQTHARLLAAGSIDEARERLNRFLIERVERMNEQLSGLQSPIELQFDNNQSPDWTVIDARSNDAFAFLYSVSNALALRGLNLHKVRIRSVSDQVQDQFFVTDQ